MSNRNYKRGGNTYTDNHSSFYWNMVHKFAKWRTEIKSSGTKGIFEQFVAEKYICIRKLLHDGFIIDNVLFRIEAAGYGEPDEPLTFTTPIGVIRNGVEHFLQKWSSIRKQGE